MKNPDKSVYLPSSIHQNLSVVKEYLFVYDQPFALESGEYLEKMQLAYTTYGKLNDRKDNIIWICHAFTANARTTDWWEGMVGENDFFNPKEHFVICANVLGSPYGSSSPVTINPKTGENYYTDFPLVTIRDMANALDLLRKHLHIEKIKLCVGGSLGGQQALEWSVLQPDLFENLMISATNAFHSPWGIAFNEAQRMAIYADQTWNEPREDAGQAGLAAARAIALLSYRNFGTYNRTQAEPNNNKIDDFRASSYQRYQGQKLVNRFNALTYLTLSKMMDSHNLGRNRESVAWALGQIKAKTLIVGIDSDILFPVHEQKFLADHIPNSKYIEMESTYGHDGFLIETQKLSVLLADFLK
ncbi:MAG: homoserine O-acetyltransferase [Bacteroidetes bacterium]|nr:MAG: homoserine O-acetyltransferase [Bacteroidota bacterium]